MKRRGTPVASTHPARKDHPQFWTMLGIRPAAHSTTLQGQQTLAVGFVLRSYFRDLVQLEAHSRQWRRFDRERLGRAVLVSRIWIVGEHLALFYLLYRVSRPTVRRRQTPPRWSFGSWPGVFSGPWLN